MRNIIIKWWLWINVREWWWEWEKTSKQQNEKKIWWREIGQANNKNIENRFFSFLFGKTRIKSKSNFLLLFSLIWILSISTIYWHSIMSMMCVSVIYYYNWTINIDDDDGFFEWIRVFCLFSFKKIEILVCLFDSRPCRISILSLSGL